MIQRIKKELFCLFGIALILPSTALAVRTRDTTIEDSKVKALGETGLATNVKTASDVVGIIQGVVGWIQVFFYVAATLMVVLAAWDYLNSGGNEEKVQSAKNKLIYAIVAVIIAVIAGGVVRLVFTFVTGDDVEIGGAKTTKEGK